MKSYSRVFVFLLIISIPVNLRAQHLNWAIQTGDWGADVCNALYTDAAGNVYKAGNFSGVDVDFDPGPGSFLLSSVKSVDAYVAKYSATGQFIWAFHIGGTERNDVIALTSDASGNILITGYFRGKNVDFDPGEGEYLLTNNGEGGWLDPGYGGDIFVAKYNASGKFVWAFNVGGFSIYDCAIAIATDASENVYIGGYFKHNVDFDPSEAKSVLDSDKGSMFVAKYSSTGAYQWAFNLGRGNDNNSVFDLATDATGNLYVTGYFQGSKIDFDPSPAKALLSSNGNYEFFVAKYNTKGQYQFAFSAGGSGNDVGRGITLDKAGNVYVLGDFTGKNVDFNPGEGKATLSTNGKNADVFLAKYSSTGEYIWAFRFGGTAGEFGWKVATDGTSLFITGGFTGTADMDPSDKTDNLVSSGGYDIFLGKYTFDGQYLGSFRIGGAGDDFGKAVVAPSNKVFYLAGYFVKANVDFDPSEEESTLSSVGSSDTFLAKYTWLDK